MIEFPISPILNQIWPVNGTKQWQWNGTAWDYVSLTDSKMTALFNSEAKAKEYMERAEAAASSLGGLAAPPLTETVLTYSSNGNVAWNAALGTVASLVQNQSPTTIGFPTGFLSGSGPVELLLIVDQNATGGYVTDFAAGFFVKKATDVSPNTRAIYSLIRRGNTVTGGVVSQGIPLSGTPVGPVNPDGTAITAPTSLVASSVGSVSATFSWSAVANAAQYNVYRNGNKVNLSVITGLTFTDVGLASTTQYTWTVKAVGVSGVESPASSALVMTTAVAPTIDHGTAINGIYPTPRKINGIYAEWYLWGKKTADNVPEQVNTVFLFNMQPLGAAVNGTRDNVGDGTFVNSSYDNPAFSPSKLRALHAAGKRLIITVGGAGAGFNFNTRQRSINFLASVKAEIARCGAIISGLDWNTFEAYLRQIYKTNPASVATNTTEMIWICQQLRAYYGANFSFSMPPAPNAFPLNGQPAFSPYDYIIAKSFDDNGLLSWVAPQYYDNVYVKAAGYITNNVAQWMEKFSADKVVVGFSHGNKAGNFNDCLTLAEAQQEAATINANWPTMRGFFTWSLEDVNDATFPAYLNSMTSLFNTANNGGSPPVDVPPVVVVPPPSGEAALTMAMAGKTGAWITPSPAYLEKAAGVLVTGSGNPVVKMLDRSGGNNHLIKDSAAVASYGLDGVKKYVSMNAGFTSVDGGGHGDVNANGFFLYHVANLNSDYPYIWQDSTSVNNGIRVGYEGYLGKMRVAVGTPNGSVELLSQLIAPVNTTPNSIVRTKVWLEPGMLKLQVNGGPVQSVACPAIIPGMTNFRLNGTYNPVPGYATQDLYYSFHTLDPLTPELRDGVVAFIDSVT